MGLYNQNTVPMIEIVSHNIANIGSRHGWSSIPRGPQLLTNLILSNLIDTANEHFRFNKAALSLNNFIIDDAAVVTKIFTIIDADNIVTLNLYNTILRPSAAKDFLNLLSTNTILSNLSINLNGTSTDYIVTICQILTNNSKLKILTIDLPITNDTADAIIDLVQHNSSLITLELASSNCNLDDDKFNTTQINNIKAALKSNGILTIKNPHLVDLDIDHEIYQINIDNQQNMLDLFTTFREVYDKCSNTEQSTQMLKLNRAECQTILHPFIESITNLSDLWLTGDHALIALKQEQTEEFRRFIVDKTEFMAAVRTYVTNNYLSLNFIVTNEERAEIEKNGSIAIESQLIPLDLMYEIFSYMNLLGDEPVYSQTTE